MLDIDAAGSESPPSAMMAVLDLRHRPLARVEPRGRRVAHAAPTSTGRDLDFA
jgi:hypothetical protein